MPSPCPNLAEMPPEEKKKSPTQYVSPPTLLHLENKYT